jgi:hypothetical protein
MAIRTETFRGVASPARYVAPLGAWLDRQSVFSWLVMAPRCCF